MNANAEELKKMLHESIEKIDDESTLRIVKDILEGKYEAGDITLTPYQKNRIEEEKNSLEHGEGITNEQADELVAKWLSE